MSVNGESVYGTSASGLPEPEWGAVTRKYNVLYLHVFQGVDAGVGLDLSNLPGLSKKAKIRAVTSLKDGAQMEYTFKDGRLMVAVPFSEQDIDFVVKVVLK
jgi:hypothetical protein